YFSFFVKFFIQKSLDIFEQGRMIIFPQIPGYRKKPLNAGSPAPKGFSFIYLYKPNQLLLYVRHQSNVTISLNSYSQRSLMFCTVSCDSSRKDLSSFRDVFS